METGGTKDMHTPFLSGECSLERRCKKNRLLKEGTMGMKPVQQEDLKCGLRQMNSSPKQRKKRE